MKIYMVFRSRYFDNTLLCPGAYDAIKTRGGFRGGVRGVHPPPPPPPKIRKAYVIQR